MCCLLNYLELSFLNINPFFLNFANIFLANIWVLLG